MIDVLYFLLASSGLTQIILYGKIFDKIRPDWHWLKCSMCFGWTSGVIINLLMAIIGINILPANIVGLFLSGLISSRISYLTDRLVDDDGINIKHSYKSKY